MTARKPTPAKPAPAKAQAKAPERRLEYLPLSGIKSAKRNPKDHDVGAISSSVGRFGFAEVPLLDERTGLLVAGHGRVKTLLALQAQGSAPPEGVRTQGKEWLVPVLCGWRSRSDADAEAYLLASNRLTELGGWKTDELAKMLEDMAKAGELEGTGYEAEDLDDLLKQLEHFAYTRKVESPVYAPKGPKPPLSALLDTKRTDELLKEIEGSGVSAGEKAFLKAAAQRHNVFSYQDVAEFYAHSSPEMQRLMEHSALVIIDFDQAIDRGFVELADELAGLYGVDHGADT